MRFRKIDFLTGVKEDRIFSKSDQKGMQLWFKGENGELCEIKKLANFFDLYNEGYVKFQFNGSNSGDKWELSDKGAEFLNQCLSAPGQREHAENRR